MRNFKQEFLVFGVVASCSVVVRNQCFGGLCCLHVQGYGASTVLWKVGIYPPCYTAQQPQMTTNFTFTAVKMSNVALEASNIIRWTDEGGWNGWNM